ncbi:MAG: PmbA protein [Chloroflexota bacterium]|nr:PmbA protein [Chloroflexota bacterium]
MSSETIVAPEDAARRVLENSDAAATEVLVSQEKGSLTRFANSEIHQNVTTEAVFLRVRVVEDSRVGVASTNQLDDDSLREAVARARGVARAQEAQADLPPMPGPAEVASTPLVASTAGSTPEARAEMVRVMCAEADAAGVRGFGAVSAATTDYVMANSTGLMVSTARCVATAKMVAMAADGASGYGARCSQAVDDLDARSIAAEATDRAVRYRDPMTLDAGAYPVVFEEEAIGELLEYLAYIGFGALAVEEGRTFTRPGERVSGPAINIWDDGLDPAGLPMSFDFEGVPRRRVDLVREGMAVGVVHDLATAARAGVESTGHGLPAPNAYGPMAMNLFLGGGSAATTEELCAGIERGIWVTRLWYVNVVDPTHSVLTGMTRDGTFLIENGRVTRPVKNMRFTQSIMDAFATCSDATRDTKLVSGTDYDFIAAYRVPAMRMDAFNFTSATR